MMLCIITMVSVSFAGCIGQTTGSSTVPVAQPTYTTHPPTVTRTAIPTTLPVPNTTEMPSSTALAAASPKTSLSFQAGSQIGAGAFYHTFIPQALTNMSGWVEYRHSLEQDYYKDSWQNTTWVQTFRASNTPDSFKGKPAMHYAETVKGSASGSPFPDSVIDIYYDKNSGMTLGGAGGMEIPPGQPFVQYSNFYACDRNATCEPALIAGSLLYLRSNDKITFVGNETVRVPAGTFSTASHFTAQQVNCYNVCTTSTEDFWTAPGIPGFVKIQYTMDGPGEMTQGTHLTLISITELSGRG